MFLTRTAIAGCSTEGFLPLRSLRGVARSVTSSEFVAAYPCPALHVVDIKVGAASGNPDQTVQPGLQLRALMNPGRSAFRYFDEVAPLVKRAADQGGAVSIGRSLDNDIVLSVESVSQAHALFETDGENWRLTDRGSRNGTTLNGARLPEGEPILLRSGDRIVFGGEIVAVFLTPEALYEKAVR